MLSYLLHCRQVNQSTLHWIWNLESWNLELFLRRFADQFTNIFAGFGVALRQPCAGIEVITSELAAWYIFDGKLGQHLGFVGSFYDPRLAIDVCRAFGDADVVAGFGVGGVED